MRKVTTFLIFTLITSFSNQFSNASAITFGCSKAQKEASQYLSSAFSSQNSEVDYLQRGMYFDAFSSFQYAVKWYSNWKKIVNKSPKCFTKGNYVNKVKTALKSYDKNLTMAGRYGIDIARRYNYGSPDPCFKYLGDDEAYLNCSISYATPDNPGYVD